MTNASAPTMKDAAYCCTRPVWSLRSPDPAESAAADKPLKMPSTELSILVLIQSVGLKQQATQLLIMLMNWQSTIIYL